MSINKDDKGGRRVETEVEIQASPEAVWNAIATGPAAIVVARANRLLLG